MVTGPKMFAPPTPETVNRTQLIVFAVKWPQIVAPLMTVRVPVEPLMVTGPKMFAPPTPETFNWAQLIVFAFK
jgi:hypothetical protein